MLTVTQPAAALLTDVRAQRGIPDDALLRVSSATDDEQPGISLGFVDAPMDGDHTADVHGLAFCVAPDVAEALSEAKIDVPDPGDEAAPPTHLVIVPANS